MVNYTQPHCNHLNLVATKMFFKRERFFMCHTYDAGQTILPHDRDPILTAFSFAENNKIISIKCKDWEK